MPIAEGDVSAHEPEGLIVQCPQPTRHVMQVTASGLGSPNQRGDNSCIEFGDLSLSQANLSPDCSRPYDSSRPLSAVSTSAGPTPGPNNESPYHLGSPAPNDRRTGFISHSPELIEGPEDTDIPPQWPLQSSLKRHPSQSTPRSPPHYADGCQTPPPSRGSAAATPGRERSSVSSPVLRSPQWSPDEHDHAARNKKVFVGGIPQEVGTVDLTEIFTQYGNVKKAWTQKVHSNTPESNSGSAQQPQQHRGFGFVIFDSYDSVDRLLGDKSSKFLNLDNGKRIEVKPAVSSNKLDTRTPQSGRPKQKTKGDRDSRPLADGSSARASAAPPVEPPGRRQASNRTQSAAAPEASMQNASCAQGGCTSAAAQVPQGACCSCGAFQQGHSNGMYFPQGGMQVPSGHTASAPTSGAPYPTMQPVAAPGGCYLFPASEGYRGGSYGQGCPQQGPAVAMPPSSCLNGMQDTSSQWPQQNLAPQQQLQHPAMMMQSGQPLSSQQHMQAAHLGPQQMPHQPHVPQQHQQPPLSHQDQQQQMYHPSYPSQMAQQLPPHQQAACPQCARGGPYQAVAPMMQMPMMPQQMVAAMQPMQPHQQQPQAQQMAYSQLLAGQQPLQPNPSHLAQPHPGPSSMLAGHQHSPSYRDGSLHQDGHMYGNQAMAMPPSSIGGGMLACDHQANAAVQPCAGARQ